MIDPDTEVQVVRHLTNQALSDHVADLEFRTSIAVAEIRRRAAERKDAEGQA